MPKVTEQAKKLRNATQDEKDILERMKDREMERKKATAPIDKNSKRSDETQREYLVRTGKITPFSHTPEETHQTRQYNTDATNNSIFPGSGQGMSHKNLHAPSHFAETSTTPTKRKITVISDDENDDDAEFQLKNEEEEDEYKLEEEEETVLEDDSDLDVKKKRVIQKLDEIYDDDGSEAKYQKRLDDWIHNRKIMRYQVTHIIPFDVYILFY